MYIMSQLGNSIVELSSVELSQRGQSPFYVMHRMGDVAMPMAQYPTEPEAKAQLAGIAAALLRGTPIYCFD